MSEKKITLAEMAGAEKRIADANLAAKGKLQHHEEDGSGPPLYIPPINSVKLPSRGLVYPPESPLHLVESLDIKAPTAKEENILTSKALIKRGVVMSMLMRSCITNKTVDPDQMLICDRNAILVAIRNAGYGAEYQVEIECPSCEGKVEHTFDLSRLSMKTLDEEPVGLGQNEFSFTLPVLKREVRFKLMTGAASDELERIAEQMRKLNPGGEENGMTTRLHHQILQVGAERDRKKLLAIVENLPAMDSAKLRGHIDSITPGVDMIQSFMCPLCGADSEVDVPIGVGFFWPKS